MSRQQRSPLAARVPTSALDGTALPAIGAEPGNIRRLVEAPPPLNTFRPDPTTTVFPTILLTGPSGVGKSVAIAALSADPRVGRTFVVEWGYESSLSGELAAYPGSRHEILNHDGTWNSILGQIRAASVEAEHNRAAGKAPDVLAIDSMTGEWEQLVSWTGVRTRSSAQASALRSYDPNAPLDSGHELWSETRDLHEQLMDELVTFPGIVVLTAQAVLVQAESPRTGRPTGRMVHRVYSEKGLEHDVSVVVRLNGAGSPWLVSKCNSLTADLAPRSGNDTAVPGMTLAALVFDRLGVDEGARARTVGRPLPVGRWQAPPWVSDRGPFSPETAPRERWEQEVADAEQDLDMDRMKQIWYGAQMHRPADTELRDAIYQAGERVRMELGEEEPPAPRKAGSALGAFGV